MNVIDFQARDLSIAQQTVPPHMVMLMLEECGKLGFEVRGDVTHYLQLAVSAPLARCRAEEISRLASKTDSLATSLLRDLNADDPREALYITATFILTLIEENRWADTKNQAVLVSLLLLDDVKDETVDAQGQNPVWQANERKWRAKSRDLLLRANLQGLYLAPHDATILAMA
jgi:hypothetical protein